MDGNQENQKTKENVNENTEEKNKSFDEMLENKEYKSAYDKKVNDLLERKKQEWQSEWSKTAENEKKEAERLAKMSEQERLEEQTKQLAEREAMLNRRELVYQTKELLAKENLPLEFAENLVTPDATAEVIKANIDSFKTKFNEAVSLQVKQSLAGTTPKRADEKEKPKQYNGIL